MDCSLWHRVVDPLNPLCGCDVRVEDDPVVRNGVEYRPVVALRRIDIFAGDRPYQLRADETVGDDLGIFVDCWKLQVSPLQDELIELSTDRPYGQFIREESFDRDQYILTAVYYQNATQVALTAIDGPEPIDRLASKTSQVTGETADKWVNTLVDMLNDDVAELIGYLNEKN